MSFAGLQEGLEKLADLKRQGLLSFEEHAKAMRGLLTTFGLGDANVTTSAGDGLSAPKIEDEDERGKRVEILIHNLSHSDMALSVNKNAMSLPLGTCIARPKFSEYRDISEKLLQALSRNSFTAIKKPVYNRNQQSTEDGRYPIALHPRANCLLPLGFDLSKSPVVVSAHSLHFKADGANAVRSEQNGAEEPNTCSVDAMYFPLLAVLVHKWLDTLEQSGNLNSRKIVILISGRGTPTDPLARSVDNSTKATAKLVQKLLMLEYPSLQIITLHSVTNLFRYDENIVFVKRELVPIVDHIRNDLAHHTGEKWKDAMGVTLSFADGSSARVSAINQSLSHYRPSYMHFWQLKTFWAEGKLCDDDIESHSFEEISTQPALSVDQTPSTVRMTVAAMQQFRSEFECIMQDSMAETDLASFWLRKTKKPVLAILLVQKPGSAPKLYRGTNMEVSMPTGSLCAERNVIGSALADDITLKRQDLKMIAVYSARSLDPPKNTIHENEHIMSSAGGELVVQSAITAKELLALDQHYNTSNDMLAPECMPCAPGNSVTGTTMSSHREAAGMPKISINTNVDTGREIGPDSGRQLKRSWSETSADSNTSSNHHGSPSVDGMPKSSPRSPEARGQKRKILSMPNQPVQPMGAAGSGTKNKTPRNYDRVSISGFPLLPPQNAGITNSAKKTPQVTQVRKIRSSFSSGGLLGLDRHEIFNMGDDYEPEADPASMSVGQVSAHTTSRSFVVHESDMNPLKPCGACMEWLKKIASVNPQFTVITFTDYQCEGVYQEIIADA